MAGTGMFDGNPKYEKLKSIREDIGYKGWLDKDEDPCTRDGVKIDKDRLLLDRKPKR